MMLLTKYSSAGFLLVGIALTFLNPVVPDSKRQVSHNPAKISFISPDGTFALEYADSLLMCKRDPNQSDLWTPGKSCGGYIPVCSDFSGIKDATVVCVAYPADSLKGTNFQAAAFSVNQRDATTAEECLNFAEADPPVGPFRSETINGVKFNVVETDGVGAGNVMGGVAYRSFHRSRCYELDIRIASSNIANYDPGTVKEFDSDAVHLPLKMVLNTFGFLK
jgi:hypothetical protein